MNFIRAVFKILWNQLRCTIKIKITKYTAARVHPIRSRNAYRVQPNTQNPARSQNKGPASLYMRLLYQITKYSMKQLISQRTLATFRDNPSAPSYSYCPALSLNSWKKIQQDAKMYQNFIISYLYEAQHVSGDTPPIIRSLKLHWQPLVFRTWKVVGRVAGGQRSPATRPTILRGKWSIWNYMRLMVYPSGHGLAY